MIADMNVKLVEFLVQVIESLSSEEQDLLRVKLYPLLLPS
jgi:hypothetical protein